MKSPSSEEHASPREAGRSAVDTARDAFIGGLAVVVPFVITLVVLATVVRYIVNYLSAVIGVSGQQASPVMLGVAVVLLLALVLFVGFLTQFRYGETFIAYVDAGLARVPGFGSIYQSFREMSDVMLESDEQSFRDVKLVEFPHEGAYTLGFLTAESAGALKDAAGRRDLVTLFLPLAPNPVMGGHLVHVPSERVMDVDMTVDEGIRTVVTSGVATGGPSDGAAESGLSADELERIGATSGTSVGAGVPVDERSAERQRRGTDVEDRRGAYESYAAPDSADEESVPSDVASYGDADTLGGGEDRPGDVGREREADTLGGDRETPADVADASGDGSLGREYDTPGDVDPERVPVDDRWRDRTRDRGDDSTTDSPAEGSSDESAAEDADEAGESSEFEDVDRFERDRERSQGARRPDVDAECEGG
jgi:uncharacterized membrane protein